MGIVGAKKNVKTSTARETWRFIKRRDLPIKTRLLRQGVPMQKNTKTNCENICKAFKETLLKKKFSQITVCSVCEKAGVTRKFFYNHFKDKYDIATYIFKSEFLDEFYLSNGTFAEFFSSAIKYFHSQRKLYKKLFEIVQQNSFCETFHNKLTQELMRSDLSALYKCEEEKKYAIKFFADALLVSVREWIVTQEESPDEYLKNMHALFKGVSVK